MNNTKLKKQIRAISVFLSLILCVLLFSGCRVAIDENGDMIFETEEERVLVNAETEAEEKSGPEEEITVNPVIGTPAKGEMILKVSLLNLTGQDITGFSVRESASEEFGENLLPEGEVYLADEVRDFYYDLNGKELPVSCDIQIVTGDGTAYVLHSFPFFDIYEGRLCFQDEALFLEYVSPWTGKEVVTRTAELKILEAERLEKEKEEAERKAAEEEEAARKAAEEAAAWEAQQQLIAQQQWEQQQWEQQQWQQQQWQQEYVAPAADNNNAGCINDDSLIY